MSSFEQKNAQLLRSIAEADSETLRAGLITMCRESTACLIHASARFLVSVKVPVPGGGAEESDSEDDEEHDDDDSNDEDEENDSEDVDEDEDEDEDEENDSEDEPSTKRQKREHDTVPVLLARYRTCYQCDQVYDIAQNHSTACKTHEGEKEIDTDYFPDDDEVEYGGGIDVDTDWRVKQCPEGFPWSCCEEPADNPGCIISKHRSNV